MSTKFFKLGDYYFDSIGSNGYRVLDHDGEYIGLLQMIATGILATANAITVEVNTDDLEIAAMSMEQFPSSPYV